MTLDGIYRVPNPFTSLEAYERHEHRDLARMRRPELVRERAKVRLRLTVDDAAPAWLIERLERIGAVLRAER